MKLHRSQYFYSYPRILRIALVFIAMSTMFALSPANAGDKKAVVIVGLITDAKVKEIRLSGKTIKPTKDERGQGLLIRYLKVGDYTLKSVETGMQKYKTDKKFDWDISVRKGCINYVGHISVQDYPLGYHLKLINRASFVLESAFFQSLHSEDRLCFSGPGEDLFIEKLQSEAS